MRHARHAKANHGLPPVVVIPEPIVMAGGLDAMTPPFQLKPGLCRAAQNFECSIYGGYRRIDGYERFDGQLKPSDATYAIVAASNITGGVSGNVLTGATSGATGTIIAVTAAAFVVTKTTGAYQVGENLQVAAVTKGVCSAAGVIGGAATAKLNAQYKNLAADVYRALIAAVPGSGKVLGVNLYNDVLYAFRNTALGTAAALYKSTAAGWSLVALGREISFNTGNLDIPEGTVITGATSGATATLKRAVLQSGSYAGTTAAGRFIFAAVAGLFQNGENLQTGGVTRAVATSADTAITLAPSGRYEFVNANFTGSTNTKRMYGCDGQNRAFEFDGTVFVPIATGMTTDKPQHIAFHLYHLFLSFFGSAQHSSPGFPYQWTPVTGAAELSMGDTITGFSVQPAGTTAAALAILTTGRTSILYGTGSASWQLLPYRDEIGAVPYTIQSMAQTVFLDQQGVTDLATTLAFGNFTYAVLTNQIKSTLAGWKPLAIASTVNRDLGQYRIFFTNNYALYICMIGRKVVGIMPVLYAHTVRCATSGKMNDGSEAAFFGGDDGYVFQMDKGTSFDGSDIEAYIALAYNFSRGARTIKRYRDGVLECTGNGYAEFNLGYTLGYGLTDVIQPATQSVVTNFSASFWDAFTWDAFIWDGITLGPSSFELDGEAENISLAITSLGDYFDPFTITGGEIHYSPRREMR